jgi:hypothetical protein
MPNAKLLALAVPLFIKNRPQQPVYAVLIERNSTDFSADNPQEISKRVSRFLTGAVEHFDGGADRSGVNHVDSVMRNAG